MDRLTTRPPTERPLVELFRDEYHALLAEEDGSIVRMVRSNLSFPSLCLVERSFAALSEAMDTNGRRGRALLIDLRLVTGNNDPGFEAAIARHRMSIERGYQRIGILARTPAGVLQVRRMAADLRGERIFSMDEDEILDFLRSRRRTA